MNFFEEATLRLKQELRTTQDKEVAQMLGLSAQSWAGRKKRGKFPTTELYALVARRPDLVIDVDYILTGITERESLHQRETLHAAAGVPKGQREAQRAEAELLSNYRVCPPEIQDALRKMAASAAQKKA